MERFDLPVVGAKASVHQALAEAIEADTRGVLVRGGRGKLRLVEFDALVDAAQSGKRLGKLPGERVMKLTARSTNLPRTMSDADIFSLKTDIERVLDEADDKFGLVGVADSGVARLVSRREEYAVPYGSPSTGVRCQRPQKPPGTPPRAWFHYYPPNNRDRTRPNLCVVCGAPLP